MKVIVFGASGATGRLIVANLLSLGHEVTAFVRDPTMAWLDIGRLCVVRGDVLDPDCVDQAMRGHEAAVIALGIRENPVFVRLRGAKHTAIDVRSRGTHNIVAAMRAHGIARLVLQSTYGVGASRSKLSMKWRLLFWLLLRPQVADHEIQEAIVRDSGLNWTIFQPVSLTQRDSTPIMQSSCGEVVRMEIPRSGVAQVVSEAAARTDLGGECIALSAT